MSPTLPDLNSPLRLDPRRRVDGDAWPFSKKAIRACLACRARFGVVVGAAPDLRAKIGYEFFYPERADELVAYHLAHRGIA